MLTYQVRPRTLRFTTQALPEFPATGEIRFYFQPPQPFGASASGGRTVVQGVAASARFNANTGEHTIESEEPLTPLDVTIEGPTRTIAHSGTTLTISQHFESVRDVTEVIESVFFALPTLLNVAFADPPLIERVDGHVDNHDFRWELAYWQLEYEVTTQERQEDFLVQAWERMRTSSAPHRRRLVAGLHYFHVARRLARSGSTAGEFLSEVILNLAKSLEVLFPPSGDGRSRDAARAGLQQLGFSEHQIERDFIPAMALRDQIDVAHVTLALFTMDHLRTIHAFTERAEGAFRMLFETLLSNIESGTYDVAPYELGPPNADAIALVKRLQTLDEAAG